MLAEEQIANQFVQSPVLDEYRSNQDSLNEFVQDSLQTRRTEFDMEAYRKKCEYLASLKNNNQALLSKVKQIDHKLNAEVAQLSNKLPPFATHKEPFKVPKLEELQSSEIKQKYKTIEKLKKSLQVKKIAQDSLNFLLKTDQSMQNKLTLLDKTISEQSKHLEKLNRAKKSSLLHDEQVNSQVGKVDQLGTLFDSEIEDLKSKIKQKQVKIQSKKKSLFAKRNVSTILTNQRSIEPQTHRDKLAEPQNVELLELKRCYEAAGKRIETLKNKRDKILLTIRPDDDRLRVLASLKSKYATLDKLIAR